MLAGNVADLADVRRFLDAQGGQFIINIPSGKWLLIGKRIIALFLQISAIDFFEIL